MAEIASNVKAFLNFCGDMVGQKAERDFCTWANSASLREETHSPAEQILTVAVKTLVEVLHHVDFTYACGNGNVFRSWGLLVEPATSLNGYYVSCLVTRDAWGDHVSHHLHPKKAIAIIVDHTPYLTMTKEQRGAEDERDSSLLNGGNIVFHFPERYVIKSPFSVARECLEALGIHVDSDIFREVERIKVSGVEA